MLLLHRVINENTGWKERGKSMREKLRVQERREAECAKSLSEMHEGNLPLATSAMG